MDHLPASRGLGSAATADAGAAGVVSAPVSAAALAPVSALERDFAERLDRWLSYYRLCVGGAGVVLVATLTSDLRWALSLSILYWCAAASVIPLLRLAGTAERKGWVRVAILLVDVLTVSVFTYAWGTRASPAVFMFVPIVVGWTLVPQRGVGRLALVLVLAALGFLLFVEHHEQRPFVRESAYHVPGGRLLFFGMVASALVAVHKLLAFTLARLFQHGQEVRRLVAERELRQREAEWAAQLEEAARLEALGRLAGGVAHDFNNLLTALIGCAGLAESKLTSDPEAARRALNDIQEAAERGAGLTAQLLDFASRRPARPVDVDLARAVRGTGQLLARLLRDNIKLELSLSDEPCGVRLDPSSLERLLLNLAVNAADAMPEGGTLRLSVYPTEGAAAPEAILEVRDTGVGIPPDDLPRIFEPFFTRKAGGKGTGLGLASVYGIVKQSRGEIEVESTRGQGTLFRIRWPRIELSTSDAEVDSPEAPERGRGTLLLVDDDDAVRMVSVEQLRMAGYSVFAAASAKEALALLDEHAGAIDLLITDVSMPEMSGLELGHLVRERYPRLPILLMSGYADELERGEAQRSLGVAFLAKPFSGDALLREVKRALEQVQGERAGSAHAAGASA
jgi:signal transduction histidine kinase/CheY-like chemotaxis protein